MARILMLMSSTCKHVRVDGQRDRTLRAAGLWEVNLQKNKKLSESRIFWIRIEGGFSLVTTQTTRQEESNEW